MCSFSDYSEEEDDDDVDEESEELPTTRSGTRPRSSRNIKTVNGKKGVNMTPPDKLLEKALKSASRLSAGKKVLNKSMLTISPSSTTNVPYANIFDLDEMPSNLASHPDPSCLTQTFSPTLRDMEAEEKFSR